MRISLSTKVSFFAEINLLIELFIVYYFLAVNMACVVKWCRRCLRREEDLDSLTLLITEPQLPPTDVERFFNPADVKYCGGL